MVILKIELSRSNNPPPGIWSPPSRYQNGGDIVPGVESGGQAAGMVKSWLYSVVPWGISELRLEFSQLVGWGGGGGEGYPCRLAGYHVVGVVGILRTRCAAPCAAGKHRWLAPAPGAGASSTRIPRASSSARTRASAPSGTEAWLAKRRWTARVVSGTRMPPWTTALLVQHPETASRPERTAATSV